MLQQFDPALLCSTSLVFGQGETIISFSVQEHKHDQFFDMMAWSYRRKNSVYFVTYLKFKFC